MPAATCVPSGQVVIGGGGGGGGGGQGMVASMTDPSGHVWVGGVVAHADKASVAPTNKIIFRIFLSLMVSA
jgi:hypothetical protein